MAPACLDERPGQHILLVHVLATVVSLRRLSLRRFVAAFVMILLGFFTAETVIADSCDGDSSPGTLSISDGATQSTKPGDPATPDAPAHSMHVCHCAHAHAGSIRIDGAPPERPEHAGMVSGESVRTPPSLSPEPLLRPPVA